MLHLLLNCRQPIRNEQVIVCFNAAVLMQCRYLKYLSHRVKLFVIFVHKCQVCFVLCLCTHTHTHTGEINNANLKYQRLKI